MPSFRNPILPGFHPDPSICRVDDDFYLITSSFEYFPGVPIYHSRDLVHWRPLGHVLDRPSQLDLEGTHSSQGIYAPTIRHHEGLFYMVTTLRRPEGDETRDINFVVTAEDPAGDWSEPKVLIDRPGIIDPSLFFDGEGRAWYVANRRVEEPPYPGFREIWLQEMDLERLELVGEQHLLWNGALKEASAPEAPHIYEVEGIYYLMIAEGGTYHEHAVTVARGDSVTGPYRGNPGNPILTHRHLGKGYPIACTGHADLVQTAKGEWWMVALATRPCGGYFYNLGRETFLAPVVWEEGWPVVCPGEGRIGFRQEAPNLEEVRWPAAPLCDHFDGEKLADSWNFVRTPREPFWSLAERPGFLRLRLRPEQLSQRVCPSFVGRRQQHLDFALRAGMEFAPHAGTGCAGLALRQSEDYHFRFVCTRNEEGGAVVRLIERRGGEERVLGELAISGSRHFLKVEGREQEYGFFYASASGEWRPVAERVDGRALSTTVAGGFLGVYIGIYASSEGQPAAGAADFDYCEYIPLYRDGNR